MKKEKIIIVGSKEDKVYCRCGEKMRPVILSHIVDYKCPKVRFWNFWKHSFNKAFIKR